MCMCENIPSIQNPNTPLTKRTGTRDKTADEGCKGTMNILNTDNFEQRSVLWQPPGAGC